MNGATGITGTVIEIARPTYSWEMEGVAGVVEGPSPLVKNGRVFIAYSASATDSRYKLGLLSACGHRRPAEPGLLVQDTRTRSSRPPTVSTVPATAASPWPRTTPPTCSSTTPATTPTRRPDALTDPNRHTRMQQLYFARQRRPVLRPADPEQRDRPRHPRPAQQPVRRQLQPRHHPRRARPALHCNGNTAQEWEFNYRGVSWYEIRNRNTGTCLDDLNSSTAPNADVGLYTCNGATAQQWAVPGPRQRLVLAAQRRRQHVPGQLRVEHRERCPPLALPLQRPRRPAVAARLTVH